MSALQHSLFSSQPVRRPRHLRVGRFDVSKSTRSGCEKKIIPEEWALIQQRGGHSILHNRALARRF
jgi:hypothetical protein